MTTRYRDAREQAKIAMRRSLHRLNLDVVRNPFASRIATTLQFLGVDTVLDVGANVGQYASALRASGYRGRVLSFEPLADAYARLARRCASDPSWNADNLAVGAHPGTAEINVAANSYSSSILPMTAAHRDAAPGSDYVTRETVEVTTVAQIAARHGLDPARTWLKIDTQGYESQVLDGAGEFLSDVAAVQLELSFVPLYEGQQLFDDLVARLTATGHTLFGLDAGFGDPRTGRTLQADGIFVRDDLAGG